MARSDRGSTVTTDHGRQASSHRDLWPYGHRSIVWTMGIFDRAEPRERRMEDIVKEHQIWQRVDMRCALAARDISMVYAILQRFGIPQRRIAAATNQVQSEVSEILKGRKIKHYDLLLRIADGL